MSFRTSGMMVQRNTSTHLHYLHAIIYYGVAVSLEVASGDRGIGDGNEGDGGGRTGRFSGAGKSGELEVNGGKAGTGEGTWGLGDGNRGGEGGIGLGDGGLGGQGGRGLGEGGIRGDGGGSRGGGEGLGEGGGGGHLPPLQGSCRVGRGKVGEVQAGQLGESWDPWCWEPP